MSLHFSIPTTPVGWFSVFLGSLATVQGVAAILDPTLTARKFGIPLVPSTPSSSVVSGTSRPIPQPHELAQPSLGSKDRSSAYVSAYGARNMAVGINIAVFALTRNTAALVVTSATAAIASAIDGYFVERYGKQGGWVAHAVTAGVWAGLAAAALR